MNQNIFRKRVKSDFTIVPNSILRDDRLSFRARGVMAFVLSFQDDWIIHLDWIKKQGREGREAVRATMKELVALGYCRKLIVQSPHNGRLTETRWQFTDSPSDGFPSVGFPSVGKPPSQKPAATNTVVTNTMVTKDSLGAFQPKRDFPVDEDAMMEIIENEIGYVLTGQADTIARNFYYDMEKAGWTIKGTTVIDWLKVLAARIEKQTGENILSGYENEDIIF